MSSDASPTPAPVRLPDALHLGPVDLTITDLGRSVDYYERSLGLVTRHREGREAHLGVDGRDLVVLHERPGAGPPGQRAGLFHFALLHPSRPELSRALMRLAQTRTPVDGASDHGVSEALYLSDPDGNGIELYSDRPRESWPPARSDERVQIFTRPLDIPGLASLSQDEPTPERSSEGLVMGHMHLHVGDIGRALTFYRDLLGLDLMTTYTGAAFLAAGGYHHHLAVNTWRGQGVGPVSEGTVGLRRWTILLPAADEVAAVRERLEAAGADVEDGEDGGFALSDPWGIRALVKAG
jgi:catechol 2,3-dioxygenase